MRRAHAPFGKCRVCIRRSIPGCTCFDPARDLTSREASWSVSNSVESGLGPEHLSLEIEFVYSQLCSSFSSMPAVTSSREWSVIRLVLSRSHRPHEICLPSLPSTYRSGWERTLSTVFSFILHGYSATYVPMLVLVESDDFRGVRKFKNSPLVARAERS